MRSAHHSATTLAPALLPEGDYNEPQLQQQLAIGSTADLSAASQPHQPNNHPRIPSHGNNNNNNNIAVKKSAELHAAAQHSTWLMVHAVDRAPAGGGGGMAAGEAYHHQQQSQYSPPGYSHLSLNSQSPSGDFASERSRRSSDLRLSAEQQRADGNWSHANGNSNGAIVQEGVGGKDGSVLSVPNGIHGDRAPSAKSAALSMRSKKSSGTVGTTENTTERRSGEVFKEPTARPGAAEEGYFAAPPSATNGKPTGPPRSPLSRPVNGDPARTTSHGSLAVTPLPPALSPVQEGAPTASADSMLRPPPHAQHHHRASSPPAFQGNATTAQTTSPPPPGRLVHRHTLEVPRVNTRTSHDGQDPTTTDAVVAATGRFSPNTPTRRRGSLQLVRKATRSVASDGHLDEYPPDEEAARWAEHIKAKRAKKQRVDTDDERVVVGTKVDEHHVNWVTAYNMLTGIRFCVSRTNAKLDRALEPSDFDMKHKFSFDITGNELTPSAKYDFKFKDYAPWVFRHLRAVFKIDPADYLMSLTAKYILSELGSPGKSGSFFYFSRDYKYIIKTIHHGEHKFLRKILPDYYQHVRENPNTLLSQFYGLHRVKIPYGRKIHFVVMNNLFPPHRDIHRTFDLKGSTIGRDFKEEDLEKNPRATLKDLNWLRRNLHLEFGPTKKAAFVAQMQKDVALLQRLKIMDYSLLVGIHDLERGNDEGLRDKTLKVFEPGGTTTTTATGDASGPVPRGRSSSAAGIDGAGGGGPSSSSALEEYDGHGLHAHHHHHLTRTPSKLETAKRARELRDLVQKGRPVPMERAADKMPAEAPGGRDGFYFYADDGGFRATHEDDAPGEEIYYLGIIDCLTRVSFFSFFCCSLRELASLISFGGFVG